MPQPIIIQWGISSFFGWGVYGLNLALHWSYDTSIEALCAAPVCTDDIQIDSEQQQALLPFLVRSALFQEKIGGFTNGCANAEAPLLVALGNGFHRTAAAHNVALDGEPTIGVVFFEEALAADAVERARRFPLIVTGSTWNERVLRAYGIDNVRTILQGIEPRNFHPGARQGAGGDRFLVFSGGKAELRKGQDIVLAAFKIFAARHPEAILVTAWHSPWPLLARSLDASGLAAPVVFDAQGRLDVCGWASATGIDPAQIIDLGNVPNASMPPIVREMDAAIFTNRAEGGTNLVAMECMASGLPVVLSHNTGHLDLIDDENCYPLRDQKAPANGWAEIEGVACWGETQVDEAVERLEQIFADRAEAARRGARAAAKLADLTWARTARAMKDMVLEAA